MTCSYNQQVQHDVDLPDMKYPFCDELPNMVISYLDVLSLYMIDEIPYEVDCTLSMVVQCWNMFGFQTGVREVVG